MARQQQFYQPHRPRKEDESNQGVYDPEESIPSAPSGQSGDISRGAQGTLDNIDDVLGAQDGLFNKDGDKDSKESLADKEREGDNSPDYGPSALDDMRSKLGKGYTNDDKKSLWSRAFSGGNSKIKKRLAIAGVAAAGSIGGGVLLFLLMLPLKIESIINNLDNRFGAASSQAVDKEAQNMFKQYIRKYVTPNLGKGACHSTADAACVALKDTSPGPVSRMYNAWRQDKLEQKLATRYNLSIGKSGGKYYINDNGNKIIFGDKESDVFSDTHTTAGQRNEIEQVLSKRLKEGTLWDRIYYRFKLAPLLNKKYGIRHCINSCKPINKFTDGVAVKKKAAKAYIIERVVTPLSASYGLILQCVMEGNGCGTTLNKAEPDDTTRNSEIGSKIQTQLDAYAAKFGTQSLEDLVKIADDIGKDGFQKVIARELAIKIGEIFGKDVTGEAASKAVPVVGWVLMIARVIHALETIGPAIRYISYAANAAAAAQLYTTYQVVASETKSGQIDATQLGSFNSALSSNLSGSSDDRSDATQTPLYQSLMSNKSTTSSQTALLSGGLVGNASAITSNNSSGYKCDNGQAVPGGQIVCEEEKLDRGNGVANDISSAMSNITGKIPGFNGLVKAINFAGSVFGSLFGTVFQKGCDTVGRPFGCHAAMNWIGEQSATFMTFLIKQLVATPITDNMSGGRIFDMMAAGADVSHNASCQENLGCAQVGDQTAANIQKSYLAAQEQDFEQRPLFARMFSTDTPYSLVSKMAVQLPGNATDMDSNFASLLTTNPLKTLGSFFGAFVPTPATSAAGGAADPFGVPQTAYLPSQIPDDPEGYWDQNCVTGPEGKYDEATNTLDTSDWQNDDANVKQDPNTGTAVYIHPNKCQLIFSSLQSAGGLADPSLLPQDSLSSDQTSTQGGTKFRIATFNMRVGTSPAQNQVAVDNMKNNNFDVVGMQELSHSDTFNTVKTKLQAAGYDIYPQKYTGTWDMNSTAITWNAAKFDLVKTDSMTYPAGDKASPARIGAPTTSPILWLRDKTTGQEIIVMNAHTFAFGAAYGGPELRRKAAQVFTDKIQNLSSEDLPIFFTGDFNEGYGPLGTAYCMLETQQLMVSPFVDNPNEYCKNGGKVWAMGAVDHILTSPGISGTADELTAQGSPGPDGVYANLGTDHKQVPFSDVVVPGSVGTGGSSIRIATFNVQGAIHTSTWQGRMNQSLNVLTSNHIDISGMQELESNQRQYLLSNVGSTYDIYPKNLVTAGNESQNSIIWDSSKFSLVRGGFQPNLKYFGGSPLHSPWVLLQDKATSQEFYVLNTHDPAHPENALYRYQNALEHVKFIQSLGGHNLPILYTGDFNSGYSLRSSGNITYQNKSANLTYCIMTNNKVMNEAFDLSTSRNVTCPNPGNENEVDHIFMTPGVSVTGFKKVPPSQNGSDVHSTVIVDINLP